MRGEPPLGGRTGQADRARRLQQARGVTALAGATLAASKRRDRIRRAGGGVRRQPPNRIPRKSIRWVRRMLRCGRLFAPSARARGMDWCWGLKKRRAMILRCYYY